MGELDEKLVQLEINQRQSDKKPENKKEPTLEDVINQVENIEARELLRAKSRLMTAEYEARIQQLKTEVKGGSKVTENAAGSEKPKRWGVVGGKPVEDPDGEYETFAQAYKVADLEIRAAATALAEKNNPQAFFEFLKKQELLGGKTDSFTQDLAKRYLDNIDNQLRTAVESKDKSPAEVKVLMEQLASLREEVRKSSDPIESVKRTRGLLESLRAVGLIPEPSAAVGEPIEHLKEKHRHEEKIRELDIDGKYKNNLTDTLSEIPERIGRGLASQISEEEGEESSGKSGGGESGFKSFHCECGHDITIPPEAGPTITCGKCGAIYSREKSAPGPEAKQ